MILIIEPNSGELICFFHDAQFGFDFDYGNSIYPSFLGCSIRKLQGTKSSSEATMNFQSIIRSAREYRHSSGTFNLYTSRGAAKQVHMEIIPLVSGKSEGRSFFMISFTHAQPRGFAITAKQFELFFRGERYAQNRNGRRRTETRRPRSSATSLSVSSG
jgi:hypothetical protein